MTRVGVIAVMLAFAVAGCGSAVAGPSGTALPGPPVRAAVPSVAADIRLTKHVPCLSAGLPLVGPGTVARFHAVTALLCDSGTRNDRTFITWNVEIRKVATTSVAAVQRYFEQRSVTTPASGGCPADAPGIVVPVLVDGRGRWLVPETPTDACNHPLDIHGYGRAYLRARWRVVSVTKTSRKVFGPGG
jgi:hypothetical protein